MTDPEAALAIRRVAGYRVLRSLARDGSADVLLGFVDGDPPETVAIKTSDATEDGWAESIRVLEALHRARGDHVVEVKDVDADDAQIRIVFERLARGSLTDLLVLRDHVDPGEVVTIVAPVVGAVRRMHAAGVAHGAIGASTILFRGDGAPVLVGFGSATLFAPGSPEVVLERLVGVESDRRALRDLACMLLARVDGTSSRAAHDLTAQLDAVDSDQVLDLLERQLFEVAAAVPVRFVADPGDAGPGHRVVPLGSSAGASRQAAAARMPVWVARVVPDAWAQRALDAIDGSPIAPILAAGARVWRAWTPGRRRIAVAALTAAAATVVALAVVPPAPPATATGAGAGAAHGPNPTPRVTVPAGGSGAASDPAVTDDPVAAAVPLVLAHDRCLRASSLLCLDAVDQADSTALRADRDAVRAAQQGGEAPDPLVPVGNDVAPELIERLGDSALIRLVTIPSPDGATPTASPRPQRGPASLLLVKGEAGWRIRDVVPGSD